MMPSISPVDEKMLIFPPPEPYLRRVLIIISDGQDNQSEHTREEALAMAQRAEVTIYAISTNARACRYTGTRFCDAWQSKPEAGPSSPLKTAKRPRISSRSLVNSAANTAWRTSPPTKPTTEPSEDRHRTASEGLAGARQAWVLRTFGVINPELPKAI